MANGIKVQKGYLISINGCCIWIQIIFAIIIIGLILWEGIRREDSAGNYQNYIVKGEEYTLLIAFICIGINLFFLIIFCLTCICGGCPCVTIATLLYALMMIAWFAAGGVEVYAAVQFKDALNIFGIKITTEQSEELFRRRAAAAALCFANGLMYLVSVQQYKTTQAVYTNV